MFVYLFFACLLFGLLFVLCWFVLICWLLFMYGYLVMLVTCCLLLSAVTFCLCFAGCL